MRRAMLTAVIVIAATQFLALNRPTSTATQSQLSTEEIISKNVQAAGGADALARVKTVAFTAGPARYKASADGRMKVRYVLEEPASYEVLKTLGPERHHVLSTEGEGLRASFSVDASDFLVKRMVLSGVDAAGETWEESTEFGSAEAVEGIQLPTALYVSQVGVGGTYSPGPRPLTDFRINAELEANHK